MKSLNKTISILLATSFVVAMVFTVITYGNIATAQNCSQDQAIGTLSGYMIATNLPSSGDQNKIWLNSEDDPWSTGPAYAVTYDASQQIFSGRGWNEGLRVWIDFDYAGHNDQAQVLDSNENPVGGFAWGYWTGVILGLTNVSFDLDASGSSFDVFSNPYNYQYVSGQTSEDIPVGLGEILFDNVVFNANDIPLECIEYVDVFANGSSEINLPNCGGTVGLTWNTNNIVPGSCTTVDNGAPWPNPGSSVADSNTTTAVSSGAITESVQFKISCTGENTGNPVVGTAVVNCTQGNDGGGPSEQTPFYYIES